MVVTRRISGQAGVRASMPKVVCVLEDSVFMRQRFLSRAAACVTAVVMILVSLGMCHAQAKVTVRKASSSKLYVPAKMITGSLLTKGRVFSRPTVYESTLAGIRLGRPANEVLAKWGNPTRITLGSVQGEAAAQQTAPSIPYVSAGGSPFMEATMGLPGLPGLQPPGTTSAPGTPSSGGQSASLRQEEVTWTYDLPNGITLEFIVTEGTVTQITVGGIGPWSYSKTRTGLQLGDTYKLVLWVNGYPESQRYVGRFLRLSYVEKSRVLFTFLDRKVVGVTIALVPQEIAGK